MSQVLLSGPRWQGRPGARRRARLRRVASALLLGAAVLLAGRTVLARTAPATDPVLVATRDLAAGDALRAADLRVVQRAREPGAPTALSDAPAVVGAVLATPLRAGEEVTSGRLVGPDLLDGQPAGTRAIWLPAAGADALTGIGPGGRVDVHAPGTAQPVLRDVLVLVRTGVRAGSAAGPFASGSEGAAGLLVAAPAADAARVLGARPDEVESFRFALSGG